MKIESHCIVCADNFVKTGKTKFEISTIMLDVRDEGVYELTCTKGHEYAVILLGAKHETLYFIALNAFRDGYYRESVVSFASSLERFYEFFLRAASYFSRKQDDGGNNNFDKNWNKLKFSERQVGAYVACVEFVFDSEAAIIDDSWAGFRNRVVHQGYIPNPLEVLEYGQEICNAIAYGAELLHKKYGEDIWDFYKAYELQMPKIEGLKKPLVQHIMMGVRLMDIINKDSESRSVRKTLKRMFGEQVIN